MASNVASTPAGESAAAGMPAASPAPSGPSALRRVLGYLSLAVKLALFALVFALAVRNSEPVTLRFFLGREVETSLALALVAALCAGALSGVLAMAGYAFALRRDAQRARTEATALLAERDGLRAERETLRAELGARSLSAPPVCDGLPGQDAHDRQVPHGL